MRTITQSPVYDCPQTCGQVFTVFKFIQRYVQLFTHIQMIVQGHNGNTHNLSLCKIIPLCVGDYLQMYVRLSTYMCNIRHYHVHDYRRITNRSPQYPQLLATVLDLQHPVVLLEGRQGHLYPDVEISYFWKSDKQNFIPLCSLLQDFYWWNRKLILCWYFSITLWWMHLKTRNFNSKVKYSSKER